MLTESQQSLIQSLEGWCSREKADAIHSIILENRPSKCVELGVFGSRSLIAVGFGLKDTGCGTVWGIDPWTNAAAVEGEEGTPNGDWWSKLNMDLIRNGAMNAVTTAGLWPWVRVIVAKSQECYDKFSEIDFLHIDAAHAEAQAFNDASLWYPRVRTGGVILFDDIDWPTTAKAVSYLGERCNTLFDVGTCRVFQKK